MGNACTTLNSNDPAVAPKSVVVKPGVGADGAIRRNAGHAESLQSTAYPGEVLTCHDAFRRGARTAATGPCYGTRPVVDGKAGAFVWMTWTQVRCCTDHTTTLPPHHSSRLQHPTHQFRSLHTLLVILLAYRNLAPTSHNCIRLPIRLTLWARPLRTLTWRQ